MRNIQDIPMVSLDDIRAARERIRGTIRMTPVSYSEKLSRETGNSVYLKLESLNVTGSYKERGALNALLQMTQEQRQIGVIAASAGNHAQAVAHHAGRLQIHARIVMPLYTPSVKVTSTQEWGAEVILHGQNFDEALLEARRLARESGAILLHAFNDPREMAGQGTIGLELLEQIPDLEAVVVPVGGGGLIGGIACAIKSISPSIRVIGVEPAALPSMKKALEAGHPVEVPSAPTIADGAAVRRVGDLTLAVAQKYVDDVVTVDDEEVAIAILRLLEKQKTLAEGAGALAVAALLQHKTGLQDKKVAAIVSGGNIDVTLLAHIIEQGLVKDGRLVRLRVTLPDHPGGLERLTSVISQQRANVVQVVHDRAYFGVHLGQAKIDVTMETRGAEHAESLMTSMREAGYIFERVM
ncbi:MAG: threonine ammonia-lyase [Acidobacteriota bacterium]